MASGAYTYERLVREVEAVALAGAAVKRPSRVLSALHCWGRAADRLAWAKVAVLVQVAMPLRTFALRRFPAPLLAFIRRRFAGTAAEAAALQSAE